MAAFPNAVKAFTTKNPGDTIQSVDVDDLQDEVTAIEDGYLNGKAGLNSSHSTLVSLSVTGGSTLVTLQVTGNSTLGSTITIGSVAYQFPAAAPTSSGLSLVVASTGTPNVLAWQSVGVTAQTLDKSITEQSVTNSTTETSVYSFVVPGGTLSSNKMLRVTMTGSYLNATAGNQNLFIAVKYGGALVAGSTAGGNAVGGGGYAANVSPHPVFIQSLINANGATNSQRAVTRLKLGVAQVAETDWNTPNTDNMNMATSLAVDASTNQTLTVLVTHGSVNSSLTFKRFSAVTELLG